MIHKKRLCILQVAPTHPDPLHVEMFRDKEECDFYFVTHDKEHPDALQFCPNTTWTDTRNILAAKVPKDYEYYAFVDYDYIFRPQRDLGPLEQILEDLEEYNPAVLTYYPGTGLTTPFAQNTEYRDSTSASVLPFSHCGMKVTHHSLMSWFFPMVTRFGGGVEACHLFNILEIPFLKHVVCSHKMVYDNGFTDEEAPHNLDGAWNKYRMDEMWKWIRPAFKKVAAIDSYAQTEAAKLDSLLPKAAFVNLFLAKNITPSHSEPRESYLDLELLNKFFDLSHERFLNIGLSLEKREESPEALKTVREHVSNITFNELKTTEDPWLAISRNINEHIVGARKFTVNEIVEEYQRSAPPSLFKNSCAVNEDILQYLKDKRVAIVGPAPYLRKLNKGGEIDGYDVIVRIQHDIPNTEDYGSRTDIVQSCLNSNYGPPVTEHLRSLPLDCRPKFVICNDTASEQKPDGSWAFVDEVYEATLADLDVPLVHLRNKDGTWDRWNLYWEVYPKEHIEYFGLNKYSYHTANFNSGYGALNYLLRYPIKELGVFGIDFYNCAVPQSNEAKYNEEYIKTYGNEGRSLGPSLLLHDQMSQMLHCKNVLLQDERFNLDPIVKEKLLSDEVTQRLTAFKSLPKFKHETR